MFEQYGSYGHTLKLTPAQAETTAHGISLKIRPLGVERDYYAMILARSS
jgi:hypothetical protein